MRPFLIKILLFLLPVVGLLIYGDKNYTKSGGDLSRLGKVPFPIDYQKNFIETYSLPKQWYNYTELKNKSQLAIDVFTIGDSFSAQGSFGYQNVLANKYHLSVLNFDYWSYQLDDYDPMSFLKYALSSNIIDSLDVKFVLLECVERDFIKYLGRDGLKYKHLTKKAIIHHPMRDVDSYNFKDRLHDSKLFLFNSILYEFSPKPFTTDVCRLKLKQPLFTEHSDELIFYNRDVSTIDRNNAKTMTKLNNELNVISHLLMSKGVQLIVVPAVDKYDLYSSYIVDNPYKPNRFFDLFEGLEKDYLYLNTKSVLSQHLVANELDIYFADDTHWSPKGAEIIAKHIDSLIKNIN